MKELITIIGIVILLTSIFLGIVLSELLDINKKEKENAFFNSTKQKDLNEYSFEEEFIAYARIEAIEYIKNIKPEDCKTLSKFNLLNNVYKNIIKELRNMGDIDNVNMHTHLARYSDSALIMILNRNHDIVAEMRNMIDIKFDEYNRLKEYESSTANGIEIVELENSIPIHSTQVDITEHLLNWE